MWLCMWVWMRNEVKKSFRLGPVAWTVAWTVEPYLPQQNENENETGFCRLACMLWHIANKGIRRLNSLA